jgi:hypothetical protein
MLALGAGATVSACGGGTPQAAPPLAISSSTQATVPLVISTVAGSPAVTVSLPQQDGYKGILTIQNAVAPAGATFTVVGSGPNPSGLPGLTTTASVRKADPAAVEYTVLISAVITVAVAVVCTGITTLQQTFPAGTLSTLASYSLAYTGDGGLTWTIIAGPATTTDGITLTFTALLPYVTFVPQQQYGFAIVQDDT